VGLVEAGRAENGHTRTHEVQRAKTTNAFDEDAPRLPELLPPGVRSLKKVALRGIRR
jgi:hypothetical protein